MEQCFVGPPSVSFIVTQHCGNVAAQDESVLPILHENQQLITLSLLSSFRLENPYFLMVIYIKLL